MLKKNTHNEKNNTQNKKINQNSTKSAEHYYTKTPTSEINEKTFTVEFEGLDYAFKSVSGVFGFQDKIDKVSMELIKNFDPYLNSTFEVGRITRKIECLDLGCGFGAIGILLAHKYPETHFTLADINERAVEYAEYNVINANIKKKINVWTVQSDLFSELTNINFDNILCNPPFAAGKKIITRLIDDSYDHLNEKGSLWLVAYHNKGGAMLERLLNEKFSSVTTISKSGGIRVYMACK